MLDSVDERVQVVEQREGEGEEAGTRSLRAASRLPVSACIWEELSWRNRPQDSKWRAWCGKLQRTSSTVVVKPVPPTSRSEAAGLMQTSPRYQQHF